MNNSFNSELLKMSISALRANPMRSVLTTLGIIIGTAIVIIVLSIGAGIEALILNQLSSIKPESLYIEIQVPSEGTRFEKDSKTADSIASGVQITTMKIQDVEDAKDHYNIELGYGMVFAQGKLSYLNETKTALIFAVQEDYMQMEQLEFSEGRFFTKREDDALMPVIVLGSKIKEELFGLGSALGQSVKLDQKNYEVVGVVSPIGLNFLWMWMKPCTCPYKPFRKKSKASTTSPPSHYKWKTLA
jgi:putative ABC transport system permease protein